MCAKHYQRQRMSGALGRTCAENSCSRGAFARGYCSTHYSRRVRAGEYGSERAEGERDRWSGRLYGLKRGEYRMMLDAQGGGCALCGAVPPSARRLHIDHDHATGAVRALLCRACNNGLGSFRDDPELMRKAADYVERYRC